MKQEKKILVIQPLPGIGDLFWFDAALQSLSSFYKIPLTLLTKRQSQAQHLYKDSPYVKEVLWLERPGRHGGILGVIRLALFLRRENFSIVWILHKSWCYRWACKLAGIQEIFKYESETQGRDRHPIQRGNFLLKENDIPLLNEPKFLVSSTAKKQVQEKLSAYKKPWVAIGIGGTEPSKKWAASHWEDMAVWLSQTKKMSVFLLGGAREQEEATQMERHIREKGGEAVALTGFSLQESMAFLDHVQLFVGNDTGMMNGAAVLNRPTIGLFLASPPLSYRRGLKALTPLPSQQGIFLSHVQDAVNQVRLSVK